MHHRWEAWTVYLQDRQPHWEARHYQDHVVKAQAGGVPASKGTRGKGITSSGPLYELMGMKLGDLAAPNPVHQPPPLTLNTQKQIEPIHGVRFVAAADRDETVVHALSYRGFRTSGTSARYPPPSALVSAISWPMRLPSMSSSAMRSRITACFASTADKRLVSPVR